MNRRLGKYEILEEIGRGGFATVYRARDPDLDREVAIKVLDPLLMRDPSLVERFRREARAAARLRHPNIVRIHEISDAGGMLAIVMELLPGPSLREVIAQEAPLSVERAVKLLRPLAAALDYAHAQGLVHRDVKPSNVLLDEQGQPVLTDFGLVKAAEESGSMAVSLTLSQTGMTLGTPAYMAPEQADPKARAPVDHRADLYSLGVIAYEMLAGGVPFQGNTPLAVAMGHLLEPPPPPRERNPALPAGVETALLKALEKQPEARFQNAAALVRALEAGVAPGMQPGVQPGVEPSGEAVRAQAAAPERTPADTPAFRKEPVPTAEQGPVSGRARVAPAREEARREPARRAWLLPAVVILAIGFTLTMPALLGDKTATPTSTPEPTIRAAGEMMTRATDGATPTATVVLTINTQPVTALPTEIRPGVLVVVTHTGGGVLNLRESPTSAGNVVVGAPEGTVLTVLEGPEQADEYTWWKVRTPEGVEGWTAANWLLLKTEE